MDVWKIWLFFWVKKMNVVYETLYWKDRIEQIILKKMIIVQTCGWSFLLGLNVVGWVWLCDISESEQTPRILSLLKSEKKRKGAPLSMEKKKKCVRIFFTSQISYNVSVTRAHLLCTDSVWKIRCFSTFQDYVHTIICDWQVRTSRVFHHAGFRKGELCFEYETLKIPDLFFC